MINSPSIWIGLPLAAALGLWFLRRWPFLSASLAASLCLVLAILAWLVPIASITNLSRTFLEVSDTFSVLGRRFVISNSERPFLVLIYLVGAFWLFTASLAAVRPSFIPLGLAIIALLVSALAVEPFLYAALLIEIAVLISIPLLIPPGQKPGQGIIRFLIFQSLAMPFMLLAGWVARGVEANPADEQLLFQAAALLGLGFAFWLAVFPFHSWVPMLSSEAHPLVVGFILSLFPLIFLLLVMDFINAYVWLRDYPLLLQVIRITGAMMVASSGILAAFEQNISRLFGYAVLLENGFALLALGLGNHEGVEILTASFLPRLVGLAVWALVLSIYYNLGFALTFKGLRGIMPRHPLANTAMILSMLSLAGLPLLPGFPMRQALIEVLASQSPLTGFWVLVGTVGFLASGLRTLVTTVGNGQRDWRMDEGRFQVIIMMVSIVLLLLIGMLPQWFLPATMSLIGAFDRLW